MILQHLLLCIVQSEDFPFEGLEIQQNEESVRGLFATMPFHKGDFLLSIEPEKIFQTTNKNFLDSAKELSGAIANGNRYLDITQNLPTFEDFKSDFPHFQTDLISDFKLLFSITELQQLDSIHELDDATLHAVLVIRSRSFFVKEAGFLLAPYIDMANHSMLPNAKVSYDYTNKTLAVEAKRDIGEGEEITISYGNKKAGMFFMTYGFVPKFLAGGSQLSHDKCLEVEHAVKKHEENPRAKPFIDLFRAVCTVEQKYEL